MSRILRARQRAHNPHTTTIRPAVSTDPAVVLGSRTEAATAPPVIGPRGRRVAVQVLTVSAVAAVLLAVPSAAFADPGAPVVVAANTLPVVIANLQTWVMGILAAV